MIRRMLELVAFMAVVVALVLGITSLSPAALPRVTRVSPPQENKSVCLPGATGAGTLFSANARGLAVLGGAEAPVSEPIVSDGQEQPVVLTGAGHPVGGFLVADAAVRTWTQCGPAQTQGMLIVPDVSGTELLVTNSDSSEAVVDLTLLGASGEIAALGARGIVLSPNSTRLVALSVMVEAAGPVAVSYKATRGRVTMVSRTRIPPVLDSATVALPAVSHLFSGVPAGAGSVSVLLANPSTTRAVVDVTALGATAAYVPEGGKSIEVPPRTAVAVPLGAALAGEPTALRVDADRAVGAAVVVGEGEGRVSLSQVVASDELEAMLPAGGMLQLTSSGGAATVRVLRGTKGDERAIDVVVPESVTVTVPLAEGASAAERLRIDANVPVYGAVVFTGTAGAMVVPLGDARAAETPPMDAELDPLLR